MANFNRVILMGYVGNEPKITNLENDVKVANLSLAVTEKGYTTKSGTVVPDKTIWIDLVAWRGLATIVEKYVKKGSNIHIEGKLKITSYEDKDKQKRTKTEVELSDLQLIGNASTNA